VLRRLALPLLLSLTLGLAPFTLEPHLVGKVRWVAGGAVGMEAMDWFDLGLHAGSWIWLLATVMHLWVQYFERAQAVTGSVGGPEVDVEEKLTQKVSPRLQRILGMTALVAAAEAVFLLPFVLPRVFRPTMLEVFDITNTELGAAFSAYGIVALGAYMLGGPLADRFAAKKLMTVALISTGLFGGLLLGGPVSLTLLTALYAVWGLTTILLFWAALIRATREWGRGDPGFAFGVLDGARGLLAAVTASVAVAVFAMLLPDDPEVASVAEKTVALRGVTVGFVAMVLATAVLVWFALDDAAPEGPVSDGPTVGRRDLIKVLRMPRVWLQAGIVVCSYVAFKGSDDFALMARDGFGMDDVEAASVGTMSFWIRPFAALGAGWLADRVAGTKVVMVCFLGLAVGDFAIWSGLLPAGAAWALFVAVAGTSVFIYALRGVYFALFDEAGVPVALTGTAAGVVSFVGYTPDIFFGPLMGMLTDSGEGMLGHQRLFGVLALFALAGVLCTALFWKLTVADSQDASASSSSQDVPSPT